MKTFADRLCEAIKAKKSILCAGLDPQLCHMPTHLLCDAGKIFGQTGWNRIAIADLFIFFNRSIIDAVCDLVVCVKPNMAFYEIYGSEGVRAFEETISYAKRKGLLVIGDIKRGDGGDTADAYANGYLGEVPLFGYAYNENLGSGISSIQADCITVNGYIGEDCVGRFVKVVKTHGNGIFVVVKTSFKPNSEVEQLPVVTQDGMLTVPAWKKVAEMVQRLGEGTEGLCGLRNVGVVMGGTYPEDMPDMRAILPDSFFLVPGYGGQGATADDVVVGVRKDGFGAIVNNSRGLIYAWKKGKHACEPEKFAEAARLQAIDCRDELIAACRKADKWPLF